MQKIKSIPDLYEKARKHNEHKYLEYLEQTKAQGLKTARTVIQELNLCLEGKAILELGPGYGHFLNVAKERGAKNTFFLDYNPYIHRLNQLHGHVGFRHDYLPTNAFRPLGNQRFDIIFCRGSINADRFNREFQKLQQLSPIKRFVFRRRRLTFRAWLNRLQNYLTPYGKIILCPTYDQTDEDIQPCQDPEAMKVSYFSTTLLEQNYAIVEDIDGFTDPTFFPFTYVK